ncbi:hypothetical protein AB0L34_28430 [Micromonospora sp. NPDC052213]|uniref:hypothetical protein n=1 Tax=Micromonospora sp. NPDC052213 TaxID=3155812 RepID=UPI00342FDEA5
MEHREPIGHVDDLVRLPARNVMRECDGAGQPDSVMIGRLPGLAIALRGVDRTHGGVMTLQVLADCVPFGG